MKKDAGILTPAINDNTGNNNLAPTAQKSTNANNHNNNNNNNSNNNNKGAPKAQGAKRGANTMYEQYQNLTIFKRMIILLNLPPTCTAHQAWQIVNSKCMYY